MFKVIREQVLPVLATHPFIRIWHAGCATGEEVYSMAIMLDEANLLHKSLLYATDLNPSVIENIQKGIFPLNRMQQYSENYIASGGKKDFSSYYTAQYGRAKFNQKLKQKMIAAMHNLVSDSSFNEFQLIFCRNVLIYFDKVLQDKVFKLFDDSLEKLGFLVLGSKENFRFSCSGKKIQANGKRKNMAEDTVTKYKMIAIGGSAGSLDVILKIVAAITSYKLFISCYYCTPQKRWGIHTDRSAFNTNKTYCKRNRR